MDLDLELELLLMPTILFAQCLKQKDKFIGLELDKQFVEIVSNRIKKGDY